MWLESLALSIVICPKNYQIVVIPAIRVIPLLESATTHSYLGLTTMGVI